MTAVITLDKKVKWAGANSWKYNLEDAPGNLIPFDKSGCMSGQPQAGEFGIGENITLHVVCNQLSKPLIRGEKLWVFVFSDSDNPDNWLMFTIPIQGYSSSKPSFTHLPQNLLNHQRSSNYPPKSLSEELSFSS